MRVCQIAALSRPTTPGPPRPQCLRPTLRGIASLSGAVKTVLIFVRMRLCLRSTLHLWRLGAHCPPPSSFVFLRFPLPRSALWQTAAESLFGAVPAARLPAPQMKSAAAVPLPPCRAPPALKLTSAPPSVAFVVNPFSLRPTFNSVSVVML